MKQRLLAALVFLFAVFVGSDAAADCAFLGMTPSLLTPITSAMPMSSGGLVAGFRNDPSGTGSLSFDGVLLRRGRRISVPMQSVPIAPGLVRLVPSTRVRAGLYSLEGLGAATDLTVGRSPMPGAPVRPSVSSARRVASAVGRTTSVELRATLGFPVPTGIVAVISYWNDMTEPSAWSRAVVGQTEALLFANPGRCATLPPDFLPPASEGPLTARIAYVDQFGQVSPPSDSFPVD
jgi:hypothetical protein